MRSNIIISHGIEWPRYNYSLLYRNDTYLINEDPMGYFENYIRLRVGKRRDIFKGC